MSLNTSQTVADFGRQSECEVPDQQPAETVLRPIVPDHRERFSGRCLVPRPDPRQPRLRGAQHWKPCSTGFVHHHSPAVMTRWKHEDVCHGKESRQLFLRSMPCENHCTCRQLCRHAFQPLSLRTITQQDQSNIPPIRHTAANADINKSAPLRCTSCPENRNTVFCCSPNFDRKSPLSPAQ